MKKKKWPYFLLGLGIIGIIVGITSLDIQIILFYLCVTALGVFLLKRHNKPSMFNKNKLPSTTTFSCEAVGFRFPCRFPNGNFVNRRDVLYQATIGDKVFLKEYEWEGEVAYAIIHEKMQADIGVIPAAHVEKIHSLLLSYKHEATIISIEDIRYKGEFYKKADIQIHFYK